MATRSEINEVLRQLVQSQAAQGPLPSAQQNATISSAILNAPSIEQFNFQTPTQEDPRGPSPVNRVLDLLSRPLYGSAQVVKHHLEGFADDIEGAESREDVGRRALRSVFTPTDPRETASAWWEGIAGREKTTGSDLLDVIDDRTPHRDLPEKGVARGVAGFALDVSMDPLTYIGGIGLAGRMGHGAKKSISDLGRVEEGAEGATQSILRDVERRAAGLAETEAGRIPAPTIPLRGQTQEPPRVFEAGPGPESSPTIVSREVDVVRPDITQNLRETIATPVPHQPSTVTEILQETAQQGKNWQRLIDQQVAIIPPDAGRQTIRSILETQRKHVRNPVQKNMISQQIRKLDEGITPAVAARPATAEFGQVKLSPKRRSQAESIADRFLQTNKFEEINAIGQTNLFNRIQNWALKNVPEKARASVIYNMLRVAEDKILAAGRKLVDKEGFTVRLTDVAAGAGGARALNARFVDDFRKGLSQAAENTKAANAPVAAQEILDPIIRTAEKTAEAAKTALAPSRTVEVGESVSTALAQIARQAGASSKESRQAKMFMQDLFDPNRDQLYSDIMNQARGLMRRTMNNEIDPHVIHRVSNAVYKSLDADPKILGRKIGNNKTVEAIMTRIATQWNAKDLRPFAKEYIDTARNHAAGFERMMTPLVRSTTQSQREKAFRAAQGKSVASEEEARLAGEFQAIVENLMGAHGANNMESVVFRSGITMRELNKELPKQLRFTDAKGHDSIGRVFDYTDGKWMNSWREWDVKEPAEALYMLTRALQLATRKNAFLDDAAARWAMPVKGGEFQHTVNIDRLRGFYFPKEIQKQLDSVWQRLEFDKFKQGNSFIKFIDRIQRMWKTGVTIYSPSHHIRNLNGDIYLAALDGVVTPGPYLAALKILHSQGRGRYKDLEDIHKIADVRLKESAMRARPGDTAVTTGAGHKLTNQQVYEAAESQGFMPRAPILEDLVGETSQLTGTFGHRFAPLGGRGHRAAAKTSEMRDHFVRMAHFIDVLKKSKQRNLRDAIEEAGRRVRKWHPDGSDLTGFEATFMRRIFPFYSWMRKATPLVFEGMAMRPHVTMMFPKAMANAQEITGIESQGPGNPFPEDAMFPDWIKEKGIGPTIPADHPLAGLGRQQTWKGDTPGHVIINPTNPFTDQLMEVTNPQKAFAGSLTPFLGVPLELQRGETSLGIPFEHVEGGVPGHIAQQVPPVGIAGRVTGLTRPDEPWQPEQLINWLLTGGLVTGTGPYQQQGQIEMQEFFEEIRREAQRQERREQSQWPRGSTN